MDVVRQRKSTKEVRAKLWLVLLLTCVATALYSCSHELPMAYVDTARLMVGFSEAAQVQRELKAEDDKWQTQLKVIQDSVQSAVDAMSTEFNKASPQRKRELQDLLSARNQQMNNFVQANQARMEKLRREKMQAVVDRANLYIEEYGKKHGYGLILGTAAGNIVYADRERYDVTDDIIAGLNERYK
jgi:Skp family chaperone for outer membrane proteins